MVQLREKDLSAGQLLALAWRLRKLTSGRALLLVNDRLDVALACGADGVQLGEEALPPRAARQVAGEGLLLGRSVHSVEGAVEAEAEGADLLVLGTIFPTRSHPGRRAAGVSLVEQVSSRVHIPVLAIGGAKVENVGAVIEAGASGAAVISAISRSRDPEQASRALMARIKEAWASVSARGVTRPA